MRPDEPVVAGNPAVPAVRGDAISAALLQRRLAGEADEERHGGDHTGKMQAPDLTGDVKVTIVWPGRVRALGG